MVIEPLVAAIRTHPLINFIAVGEILHKIGLYVIDIIVLLSIPKQSLPIL